MQDVSRITLVDEEPENASDDDVEQQLPVPTVGNVVKQLFKTLFNQRAGYDAATEFVTGRNDGLDFPSEFKYFSSKYDVTVTVIQPEFEREKVKVTYHTFGNPAGAAKDRFVALRWYLDTAWPSIEIRIRRDTEGPEREFGYRIFANSLAALPHERGEDGNAKIGFRLSSVDNVVKGLIDPDNAELQKMLRDKTLRQVAIQLLPIGTDFTPLGTHERAARPYWTGISHEEVEAIVKQAEINGAALKPWEKLVVLLHTENNIAVHDFMNIQHKQQFEDLKRYMGIVMRECCEQGFLWFYRKNATHNQDLISHKRPWIDAPVPRWLVKQWRVDETPQGFQTVEENKWANYNRPTVFPNVKTACEAQMLGIARGIGTMHRTMEARLDEAAGNIGASFEAFPPSLAPDRDSFKVDIYCNLEGYSIKGASLVPEDGTPVKIRFTEYKAQTAMDKQKPSEYIYKGVVTTNYWNTPGVTFCAKVIGKPHWKFGAVGKPGQLVYVSVQLDFSKTSAQRQHVAFQGAAQGPKRAPGQGGPDWDRPIFDAPPSPVDGPRNPWTAKTTDEHKAEFMRIAQRLFGLNAKQMEMARHFCHNDTGFSVLIGPPGTGKSKNLVAIIFAYLLSNKKFMKAMSKDSPRHRILVATPSNGPTDGLLTKCLEHDENLEGQHFIRFTGGNTAIGGGRRTDGDDSDMADAPSEEEEDMNSLEDAYWALMDLFVGGNTKLRSNALHSEHEFIRDFHRTVRSWDVNHPLHRVVQHYNWVIRKIFSEKEMTKKERSANFEDKRITEHTLFKAYFQDVDAVFVTLNSAAHKVLAEYFDPTLIIIDEAAMATTGDLVTGIVPHWDTLQHAVLAGDPLQIKGRALAEGRNEFFKIQHDSVMHKIYFGRGVKVLDYVELEEQYRMAPPIRAPIGNIYYKGNLKDADVTKQEQAVRLTAYDFFQKKLGGAYGGWLRFAVDVSGDQYASQRWNKQASLCNPAEASAIVLMITGLINHPPPPRGRKVEPRDILVSTDYKGQWNHLHIVLKQHSLNTDPKNRVTLRTTNTVQGMEGAIQFISMTVNRPGQPGNVKFVAKHDLLNVMFSRAKFMQIVVGNFRPWMNSIKNNWKGWTDDASERGKFVQMMRSFWPDDTAGSCTIIALDDFLAGLNDRPVERNSFPDLIRIQGLRGGDPGGRGGRGGRA